MFAALTDAVRNARREFDKLHITLSRMPAPRTGTVARPSASAPISDLRRGQIDDLVTELKKRL